MAEIPTCPQCKRPLQREREICIYCGRKLSKKDKDKVSRVLDKKTVEQQLQQADMVLNANMPKTISTRGKTIAKIVISVLSLAGMLLISWMSEWNTFIIVLAVLFFALPVWQVFRRL